MIRPATALDLPGLLDLGEHMHAESPRFSRLAFSRARLEVTLRNLIDSPLGFVWVAEHDGLLVGGMVCMAFQHWASDDLITSDLALFIHPEHRGGMALVRLVNRYRDWGKHDIKARIVQVGVTTGVQTEQTARLYERMGLARCGLILEA